MAFTPRQVKGLANCLVQDGLDPEKLRLHISEAAPGTRLHPPHAHDAIEAFYILEGRGAVETGGERWEIGPNDALVLDARIPHGLVNIGDTPLRYIVIIAAA